MKSTFIKTCTASATAFLLFFSTVNTAFASELEYVPLAPLTPSQSGRAVDLGAYLPFMFNLLIGVSALLAIVMIVVGGITYMTTDVFTKKSSGRERITNAIYGLLLVISSYMILYTINPDLLKFQLRFASLNHGGWNVGAGVSTPAPSQAQYGSGMWGSSAVSDIIVTAKLNAVATYDTQIIQVANQTQADSNLIRAIMGVESGGDKNSISPQGAVGLMQVMPATAREADPANAGLSDEAIKAKLLDPAYNIKLGAQIITQNIQRTGSLDSAIAAYNGGMGAIAPSNDCPGMLAYQCGVNPGGLVETHNFVIRVNQLLEAANKRYSA